MKKLEKSRVFNFTTWTIIWLMIWSMFSITSTFAQDIKDTAKKQLGDVENTKKLETAVNLFKAGNNDQAKAMFLSSKDEDPTNPISAYYLALIYTKEDNLKDAISEWKRYIKLDPKSDTSIQARQYLTILVKEDAKRFAAQSVKEEAKIEGSKTDENTVAVTYFHNTGSEDINPLSKGLAAMLITDISQVKGLKVVEREKINAIYDEMKLSESGLIKGGDTSKIGKLVLARNISTGSYGDPIPTELDITSVVINSEDNKEKGTHSSKGKLTEFFDLEKDAAKGILAALGYDWASLPEGLKKIHTKNYEAFKDYSIGLDYMDKEDYDNAKKSFKKAIVLDPNFDLANAAYLAVPTTVLTVAGIIAAATTGAPAASAGIVAGIGAAAGAGGGLSTSTILIGAGAVAVGGVGVAAAVGAFKGSSSSGASYVNTSWSITWIETTDCGGTAISPLQASGTAAIDANNNATATIYGTPVGTMTFKGKVSGNSINVTSDQPDGCGSIITASGTISGTTMSGTFSDTAGVKGTWSGTKM